MLYRWFVGVPMHEAPWDHSSFTKNRERMLEGGTPAVLFDQVLSEARAENLLSEEHFSIDGTLIRAWASQASFVRKDGQDETTIDDRPLFRPTGTGIGHQGHYPI